VAQDFDERQNNLANDERVFACLDIDIGDARRSMVDQQFRQLIEPGAVSGQTAVVAPHAAVGTIFAAKIGDLDYRADKHLAPERFDGDARSAFVKGMLGLVAGFQDVGRWEKRLVNHRLS